MNHQLKISACDPDAFVEEGISILYSNYLDSRLDHRFMINQYLPSGKYQKKTLGGSFDG
jgi:hypothetical protein